MKYYVVAGEASGDLHGANLVHNIFLKDPEAQVRAWGGERLEKEGATIVKYLDEMSFMGFIEVFLSLPKILGLLKYCKSDIKSYNPDVIILIDYPGFNLRIAEFAHKLGYKVVFYISPQIWAWNKSRVYKIKRNVDLMIPILPFEKDFYERYGVNVKYFGHPLLDEIGDRCKVDGDRNEDIALLPGSRKSEIQRMLPVFVEVAKRFPEQKFIIAAMSVHGKEYYERVCGCSVPANVQLVFDKTYDVLSQSGVAVVTSGTATLETALFKVPQVVCYKTSGISYTIARLLLTVKYISLVNLILDKQLVKELIQGGCNVGSISEEMQKLLYDTEYVSGMMNGYDELRVKLGNEDASRLIAEEITKKPL